MNGIRVYFERSVGTRLLYDFERPQHDALVNEANADTPLTSLYGVQVLLLLVYPCLLGTEVVSLAPATLVRSAAAAYGAL